MRQDDWNHGPSRQLESSEPKALAPQTPTSPGKRTLTKSLPPRTAAASTPVQLKHDHQEAAARAEPAGLEDQWFDVAMRPDLHEAPIQRKSAGPARDEEALMPAGGSGQPIPEDVQAKMDGAFGTDFSAVRIHQGPQAEAMGALAYTQGTDIHFAPGQYSPGSQRGQELLGHELAHVVQQSQGRVQATMQAKGAGINDDAQLEREADEMGARAARADGGRSAGELLGRTTDQGVRAPAGGRVIQRFGSREHKHMGDEATRTEQGQTRTVELAPNYLVSFGDLTAMSGDYFESVSEIRRLAANDGQGAGTREEIEYVRVVHVLGNTAAESRYSQSARQAVMDRYYRLAGNNSSHFTEPNGRPERSPLNNAGNYRDNHENAIAAAVSAAAAGQSIDAALLCEGFASHFLTDAYAAGHVRTERISISAWWNPRVPMFWTNLKLFIAEEMAKYIDDHSTLAGILTVQQLWEKVRASIEAKNLPTLTFGDLVSGAVHDYDNEHGVATQHGRLVGDGQLRDSQGRPVMDPSTGRRVDGAIDTENLAIAAVRASMADVERAFELGRTQPVAAVRAALQVDGQYEAERIWPKARPDSEQPAPRPPWQQPDVNALLAEPTMQAALEIFAREKAASLNSALAFEDQTGVSAALQERAFRTQITGPLAATPIPMLRRLINYTPNTGGGVFGHDTDDNAMEYVGMARNASAMATLTQAQRTRLIRDMISGVCGDDEEQAIIDLLSTCSPSMMTAIVTDLGGGNAAEGIEYLDSGVDGAEWRTLKGVLRRSSTLARHL